MREQLIDLLLREPVGKIVASNILACLEERLLPRSTVEAFLKMCFEAFSEEPVRTTEELIGQFEDVARGDRPMSNGTHRQFLFACPKRTSAMREKSEYSTVTRLGALIEHLISDSALASGHPSFVSNPDPTDPALRDAIDRLNGRTDIYRAGARLGSNPDRPLFWIAPAEMLSNERGLTSLEELGDALRDLLGLIHYEENVSLVEIRIPGNQLQSRRHARPTFADAGSHRRFRPCPDAGRARQRTGWGWTVNLARFAHGNPIMDGVPERVVEPTDFDARLEAKLEFAGVTKTARGSSGDDDLAFARRVCPLANLSDLRDALLDLLS